MSGEKQYCNKDQKPYGPFFGSTVAQTKSTLNNEIIHFPITLKGTLYVIIFKNIIICNYSYPYKWSEAPPISKDKAKHIKIYRHENELIMNNHRKVSSSMAQIWNGIVTISEKNQYIKSFMPRKLKHGTNMHEIVYQDKVS